MQKYVAQYTLWLNREMKGKYLPLSIPESAKYEFFAKNDKEAREIANDYVVNGDFEKINRSDFRCYPLLDDIKRVTVNGNISLDDLMKKEIEIAKAKALKAKSE